MRRKGGRGMSEWKKVKLGEVCDTQYGFTASTVQQDTGTQFLRITDIVPQLIDWNTVPYCQIQEKDREKYLLHKGDIVVARTGATVGYAKYIKEDVPAVFASYLVRLLVNSIDVDRHYVGLCVESNLFKEYIQSISNGSAQPNANAQMISSFEINLPPLSTQHRIATILSRYDSLIENYQKQIKLLEEAAQRLYKEWFVDLRFPGHENTKIVDGVPEGWEKKKLCELFSFVRGKSYTSKELSDEGTIMVNLKNIQSFGGYKSDVEKHFIGTFKEEQTLMKGDLIMGVTDMTQERRLVGSVALIPDFKETATFSMDLIKLISFKLPNIYLYCAMRYGDVSRQIAPLANGVNVLHLKPEAISNIEMVVACDSIIEKFVSYTSKTIESTLSLQSQLRLLTEARDRLLPKLMSGEIEI